MGTDDCSAGCLPTFNESSFISENLTQTMELWIYGILVPCVAIPGMFGNIASIIVFSQQSMRSSINTYLAGLGCFDFLMLLFVMFLYPPMAYCQHLDMPVACTIFTYSSLVCYPLSLLTHFCSVWTCVALTVDRFLAVVFPIQKRVYCRARLSVRVLFIIMLSGIAYCMPTAFELRLDGLGRPRPTEFRLSDGYRLIYKAYGNLVTLLVIPWFIMITLNTAVILSIKSASRNRESIAPSPNSMNSRNRESALTSPNGSYRERLTPSPNSLAPRSRQAMVTSPNEAYVERIIAPTPTPSVGEARDIALSFSGSRNTEGSSASHTPSDIRSRETLSPSPSPSESNMVVPKERMSLVPISPKEPWGQTRMSLPIPKEPWNKDGISLIISTPSDSGSSEGMALPLTPSPREPWSHETASLTLSCNESRVREWIARSPSPAVAKRSRRGSSDNKWTKIAFLVIVLFLICNLPAAINGYVQEAAILSSHTKVSWAYTFGRFLVFLGNCLVCLNSSLNFVIYCILAMRFRQKFAQIICMQKNRFLYKLSNTTPTFYVSEPGSIKKSKREISLAKQNSTETSNERHEKNRKITSV